MTHKVPVAVMVAPVEGSSQDQLANMPEELILKILAHIFETFDQSWTPIVEQPAFISLRLTSKRISRLTDTFRYQNIKLRPGSLKSLRQSVLLLSTPALAASVRSVHVDLVELEQEVDHLIDLIDLSAHDQSLLRSAISDVELVLGAALGNSPLQSWVTAILFRLPRLTALKLPPSTMQTGSLTVYHPLRFFQEHPERLPFLRKLSLTTPRGLRSSTLYSLLHVNSLRTLEIEGWHASDDRPEVNGPSDSFPEMVSPIEHLCLSPNRGLSLYGYILPKSIISSFMALRSITVKTPMFPPKVCIDALVDSLQVQKHSLESFHLSYADHGKLAETRMLIDFREFQRLRTIFAPTPLIFKYSGAGHPPALIDSLPQSLVHLTVHGTFGELVPSRIIQLTKPSGFPNLKSVTILDHGNFTPNVYNAFQAAGIKFTDRCLTEGCHIAMSVTERIKHHHQYRYGRA
ncbi:uncharacterized protein BDZ99DRAFT_539230 [Mytilinidion resinicola]|uniref:F-box domain-containing protein n=1 Tax=Mytilinidion resinicola TaxID=574789 RepID=A0A6A6YCW6_9PEZI|nr:uncharacterized protein BDZ99DRAFT_539230 [Mytilinidion resinicola]KAF2805935.1 hypothetical protein BDZ99DRAFT_539230 [Mytilinidion resinicola]